MRKKILAGAVVVAAALSLALVGWAIERGPWARGLGEHGPHGMGPRVLALLDNEHFRSAMNLSDQQADRLRKIVLDSEKSSIKTKAAVDVDRIELRELLRADNPDRDTVLKKVQEISSLRGELMKQHVEALLAAKSVLTPEQQKKIREFIERRHAGGFFHGPNMEHHGMPGPPGAPGKEPKPPAE